MDKSNITKQSHLSDSVWQIKWSHICELITIDDDLERSFYEKECIASHWNVRSLRRQIKEELKRLVDGIIADTK